MSENRTRVALIGAGAVGCYFIWGLSGRANVEFTVVGDESRVGRWKKDGFRINGSVYFPKTADYREAGTFDLVLVATKVFGLEAAIGMLPFICREDTVVLSLLNGVDSEERICASGLKAKVHYSLMRIASRRVGDSVTFNPDITQGLYVGTDSQIICDDVFKGSPVHYTVEEDIYTDMWAKYAANMANNLPQAVLGTDASLYTDSEHGRFLAGKLWEETRKVALARNVVLPEEPNLFPGVPKTSKYSTLQDIEAGRHTEIDMFAGNLMRMAEEEGIEVPFTEYTYHAIRALEEKNDGIIGR